MDADGYLNAVSNPANETQAFAYTADGLMTSMITPRGATCEYTYDDPGRLARDDDPAGGSTRWAPMWRCAIHGGNRILGVGPAQLCVET